MTYCTALCCHVSTVLEVSISIWGGFGSAERTHALTSPHVDLESVSCSHARGSTAWHLFEEREVMNNERSRTWRRLDRRQRTRSDPDWVTIARRSHAVEPARVDTHALSGDRNTQRLEGILWLMTDLKLPCSIRDAVKKKKQPSWGYGMGFQKTHEDKRGSISYSSAA